MKVILNKYLSSVLLLMAASTNLHAQEATTTQSELSAIQEKKRQEDFEVFNTQKIIFHKPIPSLVNATHEELLKEPSMKAATIDFARKVGGPITQDVLDRFKEILSEEDYKNMRVDTKVQRLDKNEYSNTPGWHSDFFSTTDEQEDRLVRQNPGLECETRIFLVLSGEPATEFMLPRDLKININVPSWKQISDHVDTLVEPNDLYKIPIGAPVEFRGTELHRVTVYKGEEPTVRYFMRVYLFPEGHTQHGFFKNELFNWETHASPQPAAITQTLGDVNKFLDKAFAHLQKENIPTTPYTISHLTYRTSTQEDFTRKKEELLKIATLVNETQRENRPYAVFKLKDPIIYHKHKIELIALAHPKADNAYTTALQQITFLTKDPLSALTAQYPQTTFDTQEINRAILPEVKLRYDDLDIKFQTTPLDQLPH